MTERELSDEGRRLMDIGDLDAAIEMFQSILSVNPDEPSSHLNLGIIYTRKRQLDDAIASFEEAIALDPNLIQGRFLLGQVYAATGQREKAERTFKEAIEISPENPGAHHLLGLLYQSRGLVQKAIESFKKVVALGGEGREVQQAKARLEVFKKEADVRIEKGLQELKNGNRDGAKKLFKESLNFDPDNAVVLFYLGTLSAQKKELDDAVQFFKEALEKEREYYLVRLHLAETYEKQGDTRKAIEQYQAVLNDIPDLKQEEGLLAKGKLDQIGKTPEIAKIVAALLKEGTRLMTLGKLDAAAREFKVVLVFLPRQVLAHYRLGKIAFQKQKFDAAEKRFQKVISIDKNHFLSHLALGEVYESQQKIPLAIDFYTKASELRPSSQSPLYRKGFLFEKEARYKEALESYKKVIALKGDTRGKRLAQNRINFYEKRFHLDFTSTSLIYDSNFFSRGSNPLSDIASNTSIGLTYFLKKRDRLRIPLRLNLSLHRLNRSQLSYFDGGISLSYIPTFPPYTFKYDYTLASGLFAVNDFPDEKNHFSQSFTAEVTRRGKAPSEVIFNLSLQRSKNFRVPLFSANRLTARSTLSQNLSLSDSFRGKISLTYSYLVNNVEANDLSSRVHSFSLNYVNEIAPNLIGNIGITSAFSRFRHPDSLVLSRLNFSRHRKNRLTTGSVGLIYQLQPGISFFSNFTRQNNHSNLPSVTIDAVSVATGQVESLGSYQKSLFTFGATISSDLKVPSPRWENLGKRLSVSLTTGYFRPSLKNLNRILDDPQRVIIEDPNHLLPSNPAFTSDEKNIRTSGFGGNTSIGFEAEWEFSKKHGLVFSVSEWQNAAVSQDTIPLLLSPTDPAIIVPRFARYNLTINQYFLSWRYSLLNNREKGRFYFDFGLLGGATSTLRMDALVKVTNNPVGNPFVSLGSAEARGNSFLTRLGFGGSIFIRPWFSVGLNVNYLWGNVARLTVKREFPADFRIIPAGLPGLTDNACFRLVDTQIDGERLFEAQCQRDEVKEGTQLRPLKIRLDGFAANLAFNFHFGDGVGGKTAFEKWMALKFDDKKESFWDRWISGIGKFDGTGKSDLKIDGSFKSETAYRIHQPVSFTKALSLFRFNARTPLSGKSELTARFRGFYDAIYDLVDIDTISPRRFPNTVLTTLPAVPTSEEVDAVNINNSRNVDITRHRLEMRELFLDLHYNNLDLRIGRQIVQWGVVTGSRVTNEINPFDFSEFILRDFEDRFIPLMMVKAEFYNPDNRLEFIWIPEVVPHKPAPSGSEFEQFQILDGFKKPKSFLDSSLNFDVSAFGNSEFAVRYIKSFSGTEVSFSGFYAWDDFPSSFRSISGGSGGFGAAPGVTFTPRQKRVTTLGTTFSKNFGRLVLNAEYAFVFGKFFGTLLEVVPSATPSTGTAVQNPLQGELQRDYMKYAVGLDFSLFSIPLSVQILQQFILGWDATILQDRLDTVAALFVRKAFLNEGLVIQMLTLYFINEADFLLRPVLEARLTDNTKLRFGSDLFIGDRGSNVGEFDFIGFFKDSDRLYLELIYSF